MENFKSDILLIGMPMSGKTSVGKALSRRIQYEFNDMDSIIEDRYKQTIVSIFEIDGEDKFREYEKECLENYSGEDKLVLSVGGGAINKGSMKASLVFKYRIWLYASIDELVQRCLDENKERPLLYNTNNIEDCLIDLYSIRENFYRSCSNIAIDTTNRTIEEIVNQSIIKINELD